MTKYESTKHKIVYMENNTLIVNLLKGINSPVDVSIISSYILAQLKLTNVGCEHVELWTKGLGNDDRIYQNPLHVIGTQSYMLNKLYGKTTVIVNEYPLINFILNTEHRDYLDTCVMEEFKMYGNNNLNIYLNGIDEDESDKFNTITLWNNICDIMGVDRLDIIYMPATMEGCGEIVQLVLGVLSYIGNE